MVILQDAVWWKYLQIIYIITVRNSWYNLITSLCLAIGLDNLWQSSHSQLVIHLILFLLNPNPKGQVPVNNVHVTFYMMRQWESTYGSLTDIPPLICTTIGLLLWHQTRQQWIGKRRRDSQGQSQEPKIRLAGVSFLLLWMPKVLNFSTYLQWPK